MLEIQTFIQWISALVSDYLYLGVFVAGMIETVFPPIPTAAVFPFAGYVASQNNMGILEVIGLGIAGGAGATIGSTVIYVISMKLGRIALLRYLKYARISDERLAKIERWFEKHGDKAVFFGRMAPVVREMISIPAGLLKMKPVKFVTYTFCGSCVWSIALTVAGYYFGRITLQIF
ncbi:MAG: DedA family protein [Candidatus Nitrosotenuis sp.]|uniref:DedA family protein n=1 Tax=Candidatus Nitrosotenuis cloacae TaxID=1603555 RepID=UPI00227DCC60|nr:DedA family protein [Candidatus Nitrosotenuis cloacae]MDC8437751.1 DedA family protein [Candidatus Nitrosotenuis sp.]